MRLTNYFGLVLILFVTNSMAEVPEKKFAACAVIDGDLARLDCFDKLARASKLSGPQTIPTTVEGTGKWKVRSSTNPIDDSRTDTLILVADSGAARFGESITIVIRCQSNKTDMYINWNDYLGSEANVLTRIGSSKAQTSAWLMSTDSQSTFRSRPIPFIKEMMGANKLVAQVTPYNENPSTAMFDTSGLANAIKPLRENCNW